MIPKPYMSAKIFHALTLVIFALCANSFTNTALANHRSGCIPEYISYHFTPRTVDVKGEERFVYKSVTVSVAYMPRPVGAKTGCWAPSQTPTPHPITEVKVTIDGYAIDIPKSCLVGAAWPIKHVRITPYFEYFPVSIEAASLSDGDETIGLSFILDPVPGGSETFKNWGDPPISCSLGNDWFIPEN